MDAEFQQYLDDLSHPDPDRRIAALDEIGQWDATHAPAGEPAHIAGRVAALLHDPVRAVRWEAAYALGAIADEAGTAPLIAALDDTGGDLGLALVIVKALGKIGGEAAAQALTSVQSGAETRCMRVGAERALARMVTNP